MGLISRFRLSRLTGLRMNNLDSHTSKQILGLKKEYEQNICRKSKMRIPKPGEMERYFGEACLAMSVVGYSPTPVAYDSLEPKEAIERCLPDELRESWKSSDYDFKKFLKSPKVISHLKK